VHDFPNGLLPHAIPITLDYLTFFPLVNKYTWEYDHLLSIVILITTQNYFELYFVILNLVYELCFINIAHISAFKKKGIYVCLFWV